MRTIKVHNRILAAILAVLLVVVLYPTVGRAQTNEGVSAVTVASPAQLAHDSASGDPAAGSTAVATPAVQDIEDPQVPTSALSASILLTAVPGQTTWALLNLILLLTGMFGSLLLFFDYVLNRRQDVGYEWTEQPEEQGRARNRPLVWRALTLVVAIIAMAVFVITENTNLPVVFVDRWTILMAGILALQVAFTVLALRTYCRAAS